MTYTGGEYSIARLFAELKKQAADENISNYEEYVSLVDVLIEEKKSYGFFSDEEDLEQIKRNLELRWNEVEKMLLQHVH